MLAWIAGPAIHDFPGALASSVDQDQRVLTGHAADDDILVVRIIADDADALHVANGILEIHERAAFQLFAGNKRDRGWRIRNVLGVARGGHYHGVQLNRLLRPGGERAGATGSNETR